MDHLCGKDAPESAMTVDFATGLALDSNNPKPGIYQLQSNSKGHYVMDIVYYLVRFHHSTPWTLALSLHKTLVELGARPILGERCLWAWFSKNLKSSIQPIVFLVCLVSWVAT